MTVYVHMFLVKFRHLFFNLYSAMNNSRSFLRRFTIFSLFSLSFGNMSAQIPYEQFCAPPQSSQPWVYWMWVNGNVSKDGTRKDLEAMHSVGINGAILLDVDQDSPDGPVCYNDDNWHAIFHSLNHVADSLGMEIGANNGAGYWGSGGPWISPEMAMQWVVSSETYVEGGHKWSGKLKSPASGDDYRDIAVVAIPVIDTIPSMRYSIYDFPLKSCQNPGNAGPVRYSCAPMTYKALQWPGFPRYLMYRGTQSAPLADSAPLSAVIPADKIVVLTDMMNADGNITWDVPEGKWTIIRFGHQWTGSCIGPVIDKVIGPETDKLSREATRFHFDKMVRKLKESADSPSFNTVHIDSWEGGGQNWTPGFEKIFRRKRGYDILPWLPVLTGRIIGSLQETERFMYDLRLTISELFVENYVKEMHDLANKEGLKFSYECYTTPANDMNAMQYVDIPMAEFWIPIGWHPNFDPTVKLMASAAHLNGTQIVAAEALTSSGAERWQWHPEIMKPLVDKAFCGGINRLVFHRYSSQCFDVPGPAVQMNMWGTKYERTNTWWNFSGSWHEYITRCQHLLQQGTFCADVLLLQSEEPGRRFAGAAFKGYDYDVIGEQAFRQVDADESGCLVKGRAPYKLLVLPDTETMSVEMLSHIRNLVRRGASILGKRPVSVPGLADYKKREKKLSSIADELWGKESEAPIEERRFGRGRVFTGITVEQALERMGIAPDFSMPSAGIEAIHMSYGSDDFYFVANTSSDTVADASCIFRISGRPVEVWDPETGNRYAAQYYSTSDGRTVVHLPMPSSRSWFVVFRGEGLSEQQLPLLPIHRQKFNTKSVGGSWTVSFPSYMVTDSVQVFPELISWSEHSDKDVRYFSGTACYTKTINIDQDMLTDGAELILDLGRVEVIARASLNGKQLGTVWHSPYRFDISSEAVAGENKLVVEVVNLWPNRLIGDEQLPDDVGYDSGGTMARWPEWLSNPSSRTSGRKVFSARKQWNADEPLLPSGLIGPVELYNEK